MEWAHIVSMAAGVLLGSIMVAAWKNGRPHRREFDCTVPVRLSDGWWLPKAEGPPPPPPPPPPPRRLQVTNEIRYIVIAYRGGRGWSFPIGAFSSEDEARRAAAEHRSTRGGKYDHRIFPLSVGEDCRVLGMQVAGQPCIEWRDGYLPATDAECRHATIECLTSAVVAESRRVRELEEKVAELERLEEFGEASRGVSQ